MCMCFILRLAPCFVATARAVLLSALACIRNDSANSFRMACANINSADNAPSAYSSDSPLDKATVPCPRSCHQIASPVSIRISRDVFQGLAQVIRFQSRNRHIEFQVACSLQVSQRFLGTCQSASVSEPSLYNKHFVANIKSGLTPIMHCSFSTTWL